MSRCMRYAIAIAAAATISTLTWWGLQGVAVSPAAAAQQPCWREPYVYDLAKEVRANECTKTGCNLTPAIQRSMGACDAELAAQGKQRQATGCLFLLPAGDHTISETIATCRAHTFRGRGGNSRRPLTKITARVTAFHGRGAGDCDLDGSDGRLTIDGVGLAFPPGPHETPIVGIKAEAKLNVSNVWMIFPDVGIWITAGVNRTPPSNANTSRIQDVSLQMTRHAGILMDGPDSNAAAIWAPNIAGACQADRDSDEGRALEEAFGPCGGYVDRSFLGNFAEGGHFAIASGFPDILITGDSNHGTCFGCYVEGSTPPLLDAQWSQWIGGIGPRPEGPGFRLDGTRTTSLRVINDMDPDNIVTVDMGRGAGAGGAYYALRQRADGKALRMHYDPAMNEGTYVEEIGQERKVHSPTVLENRGRRRAKKAAVQEP